MILDTEVFRVLNKVLFGNVLCVFIKKFYLLFYPVGVSMSNLTLKEQLSALAIGGSSIEPVTTTETHKAPKKPVQKPFAKKQQASTPTIASPTKQKPAWLEHAQYGVELLKAHFPAAFKETAEIQPLKIGIKQDLVIRLGSIDNIVLNDKACMVNSLAYYVGSLFYLKKMTEGAMRIDLDGNPTSPVTADEAKYSLDCFQSKQQKKAKSQKSK